ncbi:hypothetical protein LF41_1724 [Lysobacter dokdonensis DS-58]|uniref:Uncharacterized protein n=1 Tax=Lysobacter dokdonensis DS-58 TaxID=1300345 RepID=A0A0A2WHX8_9GAMM|nr:hypothetical protein LF41_1724 [Lysobacter dokdonensis DS-58]
MRSPWLLLAQHESRIAHASYGELQARGVFTAHCAAGFYLARGEMNHAQFRIQHFQCCAPLRFAGDSPHAPP